MGQETCLNLWQVSLNLVYSMKKLLTDIHGPGGRLTRKHQTSRPYFYGQKYGKHWERLPSWRRSKSGSMKRSILITHENFEGPISLTRRRRNLRRPLTMFVRNWQHQWLLLCPAKLSRAIRIVGVVHPTKSKQNLRGCWKLVNPQDFAWENHCRLIMKTILQEEETIHYSIIICFTNLFLCLKQWKFPQQRQQWTRNEKNRRKFRRWNLTKARSKKEVIEEARTSGATAHFASWTSVIWKMLNWRQNTRNTKVELFSAVILWKMILDLRQYSLNKDLQHLKWQQLRSWISFPDCRVARDKQRTQCLLKPR